MAKDPENVEYRKVTHVQFDMDGLLLDTEDIYESVFADISAQYGKTLSAQVRLKILGTTTYRSCETCVKDLELPISIDNFMKQFFTLSKERLQNVKFMPGAERLIRHLHAHHIPICVATSSDEDSVKFKTKNHREAFELFEHIVMGSTDPEVEEGKPAPDIFLVAASRFIDQPLPEDCLVFEDAPNGVHGARSAGCQVVMVPAWYITKEMQNEATMVIDSLENFKPELFGLPAFTD